MNKIIGITGRAGSGKDTIFRILDEQFPDYDVNRLGFADALKESAMASLGLKRNVADVFKERGSLEITIGATKIELSGREYLQRYGMEAHREVFDEMFWIDAAFDKLKSGVTVITDVRFDNEAKAIHDIGGEVWLVERPGEKINEASHSSESGIRESLIDAFISNDGSIDDLRKQVLWAWGITNTPTLSQRQINASWIRDIDSLFDEEPEQEELPEYRQGTIAKIFDVPEELLNTKTAKPDLRHNFLMRKHLSEKAKLAHAELSEGDITFDAQTGQPRQRLPW